MRCSPEPLEGGGSLSTVLRYEVAVVPHLSIPSAVVAHVVRCGLPANLTAVARRAEEVPPPPPPPTFKRFDSSWHSMCAEGYLQAGERRCCTKSDATSLRHQKLVNVEWSIQAEQMHLRAAACRGALRLICCGDISAYIKYPHAVQSIEAPSVLRLRAADGLQARQCAKLCGAGAGGVGRHSAAATERHCAAADAAGTGAPPAQGRQLALATRQVTAPSLRIALRLSLPRLQGLGATVCMCGHIAFSQTVALARRTAKQRPRTRRRLSIASSVTAALAAL